MDNKVLTCATTMLPVTLPVQLIVNQSQSRNALMYQCRNVFRTTTSQWVVLICSISLCHQMVVAFLCMGGKRFNVKCIEPFLHCIEEKNWYVRVPKRVCLDNSGIFLKQLSLQSHWRFQAMLQTM